LANCTRRASPTELTLTCNPKVEGGYLTVFHPRGQLSDQELVAAGFPPELLVALHGFRMGSNAAIYVFPYSPSEAPSWTTSQVHSVRIPQLIVVRVSAKSFLDLVLTSDADGISVAAAHPVPH
jgi:hypothetical protein